jgi:hypothetical protein
MTGKGQLTLRKQLLPGGRLELHAERATGEISGFIGLLAGRTRKTARLEGLTEAAAAGWAGPPSEDHGCRDPLIVGSGKGKA